ncbi:hypothetical protein [Paenarthrobacter nitroguajacolicus]|uniref:hypothetical protein n=1 Tax=Paenarthrobacter nitroguajacolicus TaxID=211146 RepID=UPI004053B141
MMILKNRKLVRIAVLGSVIPLAALTSALPAAASGDTATITQYPIACHPAQSGGVASWQSTGGPGVVNGWYSNCSDQPVRKKIQLDRGSDSVCWTFNPKTTYSATYVPSAVAFPGDARWISC